MKVEFEINEFKKNISFDVFICEDENFSYEKYSEDSQKYVDFNSNDSSQTVLRLLSQGIEVSEQGDLFIVGMKSLHFPLIQFLEICEFMEVNKELKEKLFRFGFLTGASYHNIQENFKVGDSTEIFQNILDSLDLAGLGNISYDLKNNTFTINNWFLDSKKDLFSEISVENFKLYVANLCKGFYDFSFNVTTRINFIDNNMFQLIEMSDDIELSEEDLKKLEKIKYKNII